jgi:methylated-DNA-[protein]-cysteine S-methyltransferase
MCAALWTTRLRQGLPGGQPRPEDFSLDEALGIGPDGAAEAAQSTQVANADEAAQATQPASAHAAARRAPAEPLAHARAARRAPAQPMAYACAESPFGPAHVAATADGVCAVSLYEDEAAFRARLAPPSWDDPAAAAIAARAAAELGEYFAGQRRAFTVPLALTAATAFDRQVLDAIAAIPCGETRTYGALARALGNPGAARAVGHACGRNPVPLLIACHRVVRGDAGMGGFGAGGPSVKTALLAMERAGRS